MQTRNIDDIQLPPEIEAALAGEMHGESTPSPERLAEISGELATLKREAVQFRAAHGIENTWINCQEAYHGIDDANRDEFRGLTWIKPTTINAPVTTSAGPKGTAIDKRSTAFVRLTSRYVDAGAAKIGEIVLSGDDKAFSLSPTPVPDLIKGKGDLGQVRDASGQPMERYAAPHEIPAPMAPLQSEGPAQPAAPPQPEAPPPTVPLTTKDLAEEAMTMAREKARLAEEQIFDWLVDSQYPREGRRLLKNSALLGVGVLKGPFPDYKRSIARLSDPETKSETIEIKQTLFPRVKSVSPWNIFPDPACGEVLRDGDYIFEREFFSKGRLNKLKGLPGYLDDQIDLAIKAGPNAEQSIGRNPNEQVNKHQYELWYFTGTISRDRFATVNAKSAKTLPNDQDDVFAIVTMVNDFVIKATLNPLDSGDLPYYNMPWQTRDGYWAGVGVAEQIQIPQRIVNASTRALLNNAGISAGPQIVIDREGIEPANNEWVVTPNKIWYRTTDAGTDDVRKSFTTFVIPNVTDQLMKIIEYGKSLAEEVSSIPLITQGQSGDTTPETLGAAQLQNNNANQLLRDIGYGLDDYVTVWLIQNMYQYLLLDPNVSSDKKGDFNIFAHGSVAMIERSIADQTIAQMTPLAENPMFGVNPKKWFALLAKSKKLDPVLFQYTPDEQAKMDAQPKPQPPAIEVANIKAKMAQMQMQADQQQAQAEQALERELAQLDAQTSMEAAKLQATTMEMRAKLDTDRDTAYVQAETTRTQNDYDGKLRELQLKKDLALMDYASKHQMSLEQVKAKLADTAMKLRVTKELAAADHSVSLHTHAIDTKADLYKHRNPPPAAPVVEPPGRAPAGKSYQA